MSLYRKTGIDPQTSQASRQASITSQFQVPQLQSPVPNGNSHHNMPPVPAPIRNNRFEDSEDSSFDSSDSDDYDRHQRQQRAHQISIGQNAQGQELFHFDESAYQKGGWIAAIRVSKTTKKSTRPKMIITIRFPQPEEEGLEGMVRPVDVEQFMDADAIRYIDSDIEVGDWVDEVIRGHRAYWQKDFEKSLLAREERLAAEQAQGKARIKRVMLNAEVALGNAGLPALYWEVPTLVDKYLKSSQVTTLTRGSATNPQTGLKQTAIIARQPVPHVNVSYTASTNALSVYNSLDNLNAVISGMYLWKEQLFNKSTTDQFVEKVSRLGKDRQLMDTFSTLNERYFNTELQQRVEARQERIDARDRIQRVLEKERKLDALAARDPEKVARAKQERVERKEMEKMKRQAELENDKEALERYQQYEQNRKEKESAKKKLKRPKKGKKTPSDEIHTDDDFSDNTDDEIKALLNTDSSDSDDDYFGPHNHRTPIKRKYIDSDDDSEEDVLISARKARNSAAVGMNLRENSNGLDSSKFGESDDSKVVTRPGQPVKRANKYIDSDSDGDFNAHLDQSRAVRASETKEVFRMDHDESHKVDNSDDELFSMEQSELTTLQMKSKYRQYDDEMDDGPQTYENDDQAVIINDD